MFLYFVFPYCSQSCSDYEDHDVELVKPVGQGLGITINALVNDEKGGQRSVVHCTCTCILALYPYFTLIVEHAVLCSIHVHVHVHCTCSSSDKFIDSLK